MQTNRRKETQWESKDKSGWGGDSNADSKTVNNENDLNDNQLKKRNSMHSSNDDQKDYQNERPKLYEVFFMGASSETTEDEIRSHFESCGEIAFVKMLMRDGQVNGRGFVKFSEEDAQKKALNLNESDFNGRTLKVELPKNKATLGGGGARDSRPHEPGEPNTSIMVRNLSYNLSEDDLSDFFKDCGDVKGARILTDDVGKSRGFGFIDFYKLEDAVKAVAKHDSECGGRNIRINFARKRERKDRDDDQKDNNSGGNTGGGFDDGW